MGLLMSIPGLAHVNSRVMWAIIKPSHLVVVWTMHSTGGGVGNLSVLAASIASHSLTKLVESGPCRMNITPV